MCRNVLLFDTGKQRNRFSDGTRNYVTRDNISPSEFLKISSKEIKKNGVRSKAVEIVSAGKLQTGSLF
jgi:hypothetical protein